MSNIPLISLSIEGFNTKLACPGMQEKIEGITITKFWKITV